MSGGRRVVLPLVEGGGSGGIRTHEGLRHRVSEVSCNLLSVSVSVFRRLSRNR